MQSVWVKRAARVQEFAIAMLVFNFLPLAPLLIEWLRSGTIEETNFALGVGIFAISIGFSSRFKFVFTFAIVMGLVVSALGEPSAGGQPPVSYRSIAWAVLVLVSAVHAGERVARHLYRREIALLFENRGGAS